MDNRLPDACFCYNPFTNEVNPIKKGESGYYKTEFGTWTDRESAEDCARALNKKLGVNILEKHCMVLGSMFGWDAPGAHMDNYSPNDIKMMERYEHRWEKYLSEYVKNDVEKLEYYEFIMITAENAGLEPEDLVYLNVLSMEEAAKAWEMKVEDIPQPKDRGEAYWKSRMKEYVQNDYKNIPKEQVEELLDKAGVSEDDRGKLHPDFAKKKRPRKYSLK